MEKPTIVVSVMLVSVVLYMLIILYKLFKHDK